MFPHFAVSKIISADQEAFPVTVETPHWPSSVPYTRPVVRAEDAGVTQQSAGTLLTLYIVSVVPAEMQAVALSSFSALVCYCIAVVGSALSNDPATGIISAALIGLAILCSIATVAAIILVRRRRRSRNRIATVPVDRLDEEREGAEHKGIEIPAGNQALEGLQEYREPKHTEKNDFDNMEKISRSNSFMLSESRTHDSFENFITAPIEIDFNSLEFGSVENRTHAAFYAETFEAGFLPVSGTEFLPGQTPNVIEPPLPPPIGFIN
jgi:hypothetical protein